MTAACFIAESTDTGASSNAVGAFLAPAIFAAALSAPPVLLHLAFIVHSSQALLVTLVWLRLQIWLRNSRQYWFQILTRTMHLLIFRLKVKLLILLGPSAPHSALRIPLSTKKIKNEKWKLSQRKDLPASVPVEQLNLREWQGSDRDFGDDHLATMNFQITGTSTVNLAVTRSDINDEEGEIDRVCTMDNGRRGFFFP